MITDKNLNRRLNQGHTLKVVTTDVKRVIISLPQGIKGTDIKYTKWNGSPARGNGFLFHNETDKRTQFIAAEGGIFIGHEGECPEGPNGSMIMRSEAVKRYLAAHPDALQPKNLAETIKYMQTKVFKHDLEDLSKWNNNCPPDIWSSDAKWLEKSFYPKDIYDTSGKILPVISASKREDIEADAIYLGPNTLVEGKGKTGARGSWAVRKNDGTTNLCVDEVFVKTYKHANKTGPSQRIFSKADKEYAKYSQEPDASQISNSERNNIENLRTACAELKTPAYRVIGSALCDYLENMKGKKIRVQLEIKSLIALDGNELSSISENPKSKPLQPLLEQNIINEKGGIIKPEEFANSELVKNYKGKGIDLSQTETIKSISQKQANIQTPTAQRS